MGAVRRWLEHFKHRNTDLVNQPRSRRPRTACADRNKREGVELVKGNRLLSAREMAELIGIVKRPGRGANHPPYLRFSMPVMRTVWRRELESSSRLHTISITALLCERFPGFAHLSFR